MIVNHTRKIILFNVPRTGTVTLRDVAKKSNAKFDHINYQHQNYKSVRNNILRGVPANQNYGFDSVDTLDSYEMYCFYRDPFERCKSALNLLRRGRLHCRFFHAFYGDEFPISCANRDEDYDNFPQWKKDAINRISFAATFRKLKWFFEEGAFMKGHFGFLDGPVQPLNFDMFDTEARRILPRLGIPANVQIPRLGSAPHIPEYDGLSPAEIREIRNYFDQDYEYLDSKGITFP